MAQFQKTHLAEKPRDLEAATVNLERGRAWEAVQAIPDGIEQVEDELRHGFVFVVRGRRPFFLPILLVLLPCPLSFYIN